MPILGILSSSIVKAPGVPTIGTASAGSFKNANVAFTPNAIGIAATSFTATSSPGGFTGTGSSSPVNVSGLTAGTSYTFTVTASNDFGTSTASAASNSISAISPPYLTASPTLTASGNVVTLTSGTWETTGGYAPTTFTYQIATSSVNLIEGPYVYDSGAVATSTTSINYTGSYGTTYYGQVRGANTYGSSRSATASATTAAAPPPAGLVPTFGANTPTSGGFTGVVTNYDGGTSSFNANVSAGSIVFGSASGSNLPFTVTGLSPSQSATVTVFTVRSGYSNGSNTTTGTAQPSITGVMVTNITTTGGDLSWSSVGQTSYSITTSPSTNLNGATGASATSRVITGGTSGTTYSVTVTVYSGSSQTGSSASASTSFTTTGVASPATPTGVSISGSGLVQWTASSGATSYTVEYYLADSTQTYVAGPYSANPSPPTATSYQVVYQVIGGVNHNYAKARVLASNASGSSSYSAFTPYA